MYTGIVSLLEVSSMEASLEFYVEKLGFEMVRNWAPDHQILWCKLDLEACSVMLQQSENPDQLFGAGKGVILYGVVDDIDRYHARIVANGVSATDVATSFYGMKQSYVTDPDGYSLCFGVWVDAS